MYGRRFNGTENPLEVAEQLKTELITACDHAGSAVTRSPTESEEIQRELIGQIQTACQESYRDDSKKRDVVKTVGNTSVVQDYQESGYTSYFLIESQAGLDLLQRALTNNLDQVVLALLGEKEGISFYNGTPFPVNSVQLQPKEKTQSFNASESFFQKYIEDDKNPSFLRAKLCEKLYRDNQKNNLLFAQYMKDIIDKLDSTNSKAAALKKNYLGLKKDIIESLLEDNRLNTILKPADAPLIMELIKELKPKAVTTQDKLNKLYQLYLNYSDHKLSEELLTTFRKELGDVQSYAASSNSKWKGEVDALIKFIDGLDQGQTTISRLSQALFETINKSINITNATTVQSDVSDMLRMKVEGILACLPIKERTIYTKKEPSASQFFVGLLRKPSTHINPPNKADWDVAFGKLDDLEKVFDLKKQQSSRPVLGST